MKFFVKDEHWKTYMKLKEFPWVNSVGTLQRECMMNETIDFALYIYDGSRGLAALGFLFLGRFLWFILSLGVKLGDCDFKVLVERAS